MVRGKTTVVDLTSDEDEDSDVLPAALPGRTAGRNNGTKTASRASSSEPARRHTGTSSGHYVTSTRSNGGSGTSAGSRAASTSATGSSRTQTAKPSTSLPSTSLNKPSRRRENDYNEPGDQDDYDPDADPPGPATRPPKQSTSAATTSTKPKPKTRATVSPQKPVTGRKDPQLREVMKREERENADDLDFFSRSKKAPIASKVGRAVPKALSGKTARTAMPEDVEMPSDDSLSSVKNSDDESEDAAMDIKGKKRAGTNDTMSDSSDDLAEAKNKKRGRGRPKGTKSKTKESPDRRLSPIKAFKKPEEDSSSDESLKSLHTDSSSSSNGGLPPEKKRKRKDDNTRPANKVQKKRSLSPIEQVDTFAVAHALQDVRRNTGYRPRAQAQVPSDDEAADLSLVNTIPRASTSAQPDDRARSQSASINLATATEEEKAARLGQPVTIIVEMVSDPRQPELAVNAVSKANWEAPISFQVRQKETFAALFDNVAARKVAGLVSSIADLPDWGFPQTVPRAALVMTYEGHTVFAFGTPTTLKILTQATFKGYHRNVYDYITEKKEEERKRTYDLAREAQLDELARRARSATVSGKGSKDSAIDIDGEAADGQGDSDIEIVSDKGKRTASASVPPPAPPPPVQTQVGPQEGSLRLTLIVSKDEKYTVSVKSNKKVSALVKHYMKAVGLDKSKASMVKIIFDGEELAHDTTLEDAEVEDECQLDIRPPAQ